MSHWSKEAIFYHLFPLGQCAAPRKNDLVSAPVNRLEAIHPWLEHAAHLGCNAIYLGPVFEASTHGYDTVDYYAVDRRLGEEKDLADLVRKAHGLGLRVVLDGVFNHVGRDFWAFRDIQEHGTASAYAGWIDSLRFDRSNSKGDPFSYETWHGDESLVKLNLSNPDVRMHLLGAVEHWIREYDIDGLRLDAADCISLEFQQELAARCRLLRPDFWLMGEVVHGDYRKWMNPDVLDSVTNYEAYKGLYSSHNDRNYFEIAYSLDRQFGGDGLYKGSPLYNFVDNHDVNRVASVLNNPQHLFLIYTLLFTMPGIPSIYYGSEFGVQGAKGKDDWSLRPAFDLKVLYQAPPFPGLYEHIQLLVQIHSQLPALRSGHYRPIFVASEQLVFAREEGEQRVLVLLNSSPDPVDLKIALTGIPEASMEDVLEPSTRHEVRDGILGINLNAYQSRILKIA